MSLYKNCKLCPRGCGVDREAGQLGYCGETSALRIAFAGIHFGEEPPITGSGGSGTIFVSGCNLGCVFCQNYQISKGLINDETSVAFKKNFGTRTKTLGRIVDVHEFADICMTLSDNGAENVNIVTGSHAAPALAEGIDAARKRGLKIPVLWNSSGYDGNETLEILKDFVDVYLPDLKTLDSCIAANFFNAPDYPDHTARAILRMMDYRQLNFASNQEKPITKDNVPAEQMLSGVMIRHLIIPGFLENTRQVLRWFSKNCTVHGSGRSHSRGRGYDSGRGHGSSRSNGDVNYRSRALLSLMSQYTPVQASPLNETCAQMTVPGAYVSKDEYEAALAMLEDFDIEDGFCQELVTGSDWLPDFTRPNPFSSELSLPVWHAEKPFKPST